MLRIIWLAALLGCTSAVDAYAVQVNIAVAANFTDAAKDIAAAFKENSGDDALLSFGASGAFYTQIAQGAPFDVMLSADDERPRKLIEDGLATGPSRFTYAIGKLVLWSRDPALVKDETTLKSGRFTKLSIAAPSAAPYGAAAVETLKALNLYEAVAAKIVQGNSIAQAYQFIDTGNAELGFVALSQLANTTAGSRWMVPQSLYSVIRQDAVLLKHGAANDAAIRFLAFLHGPEARAIITRYGYGIAGQN